MLEPPLAARVFDEDSSHGLGRRGKEVPTPFPLPRLGNLDQPQIGLMDQGGRVERLARPLLSHSLRGQLAQFVIDQRQQFLGPGPITPMDRREYGRYVAHANEYTGVGAWDSKETFRREIAWRATRLTSTPRLESPVV